MPAEVRSILEVLNSPHWTESEKWVVKWQFNRAFPLLGSFEAALAEVIKLADESNLDKLALGFPDQVNGYRAWAHGDLAQRLRASGLHI